MREPQIPHIYCLPNGFVYAAANAFGGRTRRHPWVILLSLSEAPFTLTVASQSWSTTAAVITPGVARSFDLRAAGVASLNVEPGHPAYHVFRGRGVCLGSPHVFAHLRPALARCCAGIATPEEVRRTFEGAVTVAQQISNCTPAPHDARIAALVARLATQSPLEYRFADAQRSVNLSPDRLSHLFTSQVGLSIRSFLQWRKIKAAMALLATGISITDVAHEAGFSDSAHLTRTFRASLGLLPSTLGHGRHIQVHDLQELQRPC
jgi:AraC family transcriptional regulator, arabinose operon regulatory protein